MGNRSQAVATSGTTTYTYDGLYRLTGTTYPNADVQSYTYDAMGNRLTKVHNGSTTNYTYDDLDEMTAAGGVSYTYDNDGNQTVAGSDTWSWDAENRMTGATIGGVASTYGYNGAGLRTSRTIGGVSVSYAWDLTGSLPNILEDSSGNKYVYGLDLISRTDNGGAQEYYLYDGLGSTTGIANGSATVTDTFSYDVYGAVRTRTGSSTNEFTYTGEQNDATGLEYLRARYYDAGTGRFLSQDPVPQTQRYAYVGSNPVSSIDPSGMVPDGIDAAAARILSDACWLTHMKCPHVPFNWKSAGQSAAKGVVFAIADAVYAPYYVGYYGARIIGSLPPWMKAQYMVLLPGLWFMQGAGLAMDNGMDRFKRAVYGTDSTKDDHVCNYMMGTTIGGWIDSKTGFGPKAWFPGRGRDGTDFAWGFNDRTLDFRNCFSTH